MSNDHTLRSEGRARPKTVLAPQALEKVWLDQVDLALRLAPFTILTGLTASSIVFYYVWQASTMSYVVGLQSVNVLLAGVTLSGSIAWRRGRLLATGSSIRVVRQRMVWLACMGGVALGSIPLKLYSDADPDGRLLIAATCAGLIATGISIGFVPAAGIAYSSSIILGSFIALALTGEPFSILIATLLAVYSTFIIATILQISRLVSLRAVVQVDLDLQREVSGLLLNDFEQNSSDWLWETDIEGRFRAPSDRFVEVAGTERDRLAGTALDVLLRMVPGQSSEPRDEILRAFDDRRPFKRIDVPLQIGSERRWWSLTGKPIYDREQRFGGFRGIGSDVTLRKEYVGRLDHLANHDALTGLPNRRRFEQLVADQRRSLIERAEGGGYCVLCLDLDRFKQVNDTFGHAVGDQLLRGISARLQEFVGPDVLVSRFAGDEFAVLHLTADLSRNVELADRIIESLQRSFTFDGLYLNVGVSIGIAVARDRTTCEEILRKADAALYRAKSDGGGSHRCYIPAMDQHKEERATLMGELRGALSRGEFTLDYQPIVSAASGELCGFEALMRWRNPIHGQVPPSVFITLAEETGTILALGEWGLRTACRFASTWQNRSLSIAVNISTVQIRHSDLVRVVSQALADFGLEPSRLELEITESAFLATTSEAMTLLHDLRQLGVRLALDDFGTGYSSLSYLKRLPVDTIKIDRSFIVDLPYVASDVSIVKTIVDLGHNLGMTTIAEGVETVEQHDCLRQIGCFELQGHLLGMPSSESETLRLMGAKGRRFKPRIIA